MRKAVIKFIKNVGRLLGLKKLFLYIYRLLQESNVPANDKLKVSGIFVDSCGNRIELLSGLRDNLVPDWSSMVHPPRNSVMPSRKMLVQKVDDWKERLRHVENFLGKFSTTIVGKDVLEIGAYDGATAYALASLGANRVLAIDMASYYIRQALGGEVSEDAVSAKNMELARLREAYSNVVNEQSAKRVSFLEDDICISVVPTQSIDVVISFEVLEHITCPENAFKEMARILKPGGIAFHEYNPFFSLNGGHSLCTLDFPWGHVRLNHHDFKRYVETIRPKEKDLDLSFYCNNLNRMTLYELKKHMKQSGLNLLTIIPWCSKDHLNFVSSDVLNQTQFVHPTVSLNDLITPIVWVLFKKND